MKEPTRLPGHAPSRSRGLLPSPDLVVLGMLMDGRKHGYEMRQHVETRLGTLTSLSGGTIYYTLRKLEKRGCVEMTRGREGNRPERMVYSITDTGREQFQDLMRQAFLEEDAPYTSYDAGLYFLSHGSLEDALEGTRRQVDRMEAFEEHVRSLEEAHPFRWPFRLEAIKRHVLAVTRAHKAFYQELGKDLQARISRARSRKTSSPSESRRRASHG